jgi:uncharacterized protein (TIGR02246 family)
MRTSLSLLPFLLAAAACTTDKAGSADSAAMSGDPMSAAAPADDNAARAAIEKLRSDWRAAADSDDAKTVAAMYADDAALVTADSPPANGRVEIEKSLAKGFPLTKLESIDSKELVVSGDVAYDYGTYRQEVTLPNGTKQMVNGYYLVASRRQPDGTWKIVRHVATVPPAA